ncbi:MAG: GTP cyclohydrolase I FolE [Pseudomonadota bacterium]
MSPDATPVGLPRTRLPDQQKFRAAVNAMLEAAGFDIDPVHLAHTAERVNELWASRLLDGYDVQLESLLSSGFEDPRQDLVTVRDIAVHGMCPHHLVPWRGVAHVAYLPGGCLHGFGRIARLVDALGHRLTYQEWFTRDVAEALVKHGQARGAACVVETAQLCLILGENRRGEERVVTTAFTGVLEHDAVARSECLRALGQP